MTIRFKDQVHQILEFLHVKPGKGHAFVRSKLKNLETGKIYENTFRGGEKVEQIITDTKKMQYLYRDPVGFVFMDLETFEQETMPAELLDGKEIFLKEGSEVLVSSGDGKILNLEIPHTVELEVTKADPGVAGNTVQGGTKSVTLETGAVIQVPLFIEQGETVKVDTRTGAYLERVGK
jgi:elongation factor P